MKVPKPSYILHSLVNKGPLPELSVEETEHTLKNAEEQKHVTMSPDSHASGRMSMFTLQSPSLVADSQSHTFCQRSPFKIPVARSIPGHVNWRNDVQSIPHALPKLVNLSFSQPNSPQTPCVGTNPWFRLATPSVMVNHNIHRQGEQSVLSTPCVMGALHELQLAQDTGLPDMLTIIEDEQWEVSQVEQQLLRNMEVDLTDQTVVDYLLDVAQDDQPGSTAGLALGQHGQQTQTLPLCSKDGQSLTESGTTTHSQDNSQLNVRRKRRHSQKRMTAEEAMVIRRTRSGRPFRQAAAAARQLLTTDETPVQQAVSQPHTHAATIMAQPLSSNVTDMTHQPQQSPVPAGHQHIAQPQVCARPAEEHQASVSLRRSKRKRQLPSHFEVRW